MDELLFSFKPKKGKCFIFKNQIIVFIYPTDDACQLCKMSAIIANQYTALLSVLTSVMNIEDILKDEWLKRLW